MNPRLPKKKPRFRLKTRGPEDRYPHRYAGDLSQYQTSEQAQTDRRAAAVKKLKDKLAAILADDLVGLRCAYDLAQIGETEALQRYYATALSINKDRSDDGLGLVGMADKRFERLTTEKKNSESGANDPRAILRKLQRTLPGAVLLPIPLGEKGPKEPNWPKITYEATQSETYQTKLLAAIARGGNIGVVLGPHSGRLIALDIDDDSALKRSSKIFPGSPVRCAREHSAGVSSGYGWKQTANFPMSKPFAG